MFRIPQKPVARPWKRAPRLPLLFIVPLRKIGVLRSQAGDPEPSKGGEGTSGDPDADVLLSFVVLSFPLSHLRRLLGGFHVKCTTAVVPLAVVFCVRRTPL